MKARVLLCHNQYVEPGGESLVFANELAGLRAAGHEVEVYERNNREISGFSLAGRAAMVAAAFSSPRTRRDLRALVARFRPQVAIVQNTFPLLSPSTHAVLAELGVPVIQAVYNYRLVCPSAELYTQGAVCERCVTGSHWNAVRFRCYRDSRAQSAWAAAVLAFHRGRGTFTRAVDRFMVPDLFLGSRLAAGGIPQAKMFVNPNPFHLEDAAPATDHRGYLLYVGRLARHKGVRTLLQAVALARASLRLVVVGAGELAGEVEAAAASDPRIDFLGARWGDEVTALMRGAAAVVIPSEWYDNLPLVLCQANGAGTPVVASRIDGLPEYVIPGRNGLLFEPGDARDLARAMDEVLGLDAEAYRTLSAATRRHAEERLAYPVHYRKLEAVFAELGAAAS